MSLASLARWSSASATATPRWTFSRLYLELPTAFLELVEGHSCCIYICLYVYTYIMYVCV